MSYYPGYGAYAPPPYGAPPAAPAPAWGAPPAQGAYPAYAPPPYGAPPAAPTAAWGAPPPSAYPGAPPPAAPAGGWGAPPPSAYPGAPPPAAGAGGYGAPPPAAGAGGYGAPPPAAGAGGYGAPPPAAGAGGYGAPPPAAGAGGYGAPPPPAGGYGAPPQPHAASAPTQPPQPSAPAPAPPSAPPPPSAPSQGPAASYGAPPSGPTPTAWGAQPSQAPAPAASPQGAYPSLFAPPPAQTVPDNATSGSSGSAAPSSAYPALGAPPAVNFSAPAAPPAPAAAAALPPAPQPATSPYTYGQPPAGAPPPAAAPAPAAYMPPTTYAPAPGHGTRRRRALLVGCAYPGTTAALNGCLNDVQCIQYMLKNRFGFTDQQIVVLRDDSRDRDFVSTKANIYRGIQWLMTDQRPGDSLFFHFSGHGSQQTDYGGDEEDGRDETLCPTDFKHAGMIVDDELNRMMVRPLIQGVTLHCIVDACHSGTAMDLPFRAKPDGRGGWYWKGRARHDKLTYGGTAFQFGACKDSQVAQDTNKLSGKAFTGAATFSFIQAIEKNGVQQTLAQLLSHMTHTLHAATGGGTSQSLITSFLLGPSGGSGGQTPVLSCDKQVDLHRTYLSL